MIDTVAVYNERIKLLSGLFDKLGVGFIILAVSRYTFSESDSFPITLLLSGIAFHAFAYYVVGFTRRKE